MVLFTLYLLLFWDFFVLSHGLDFISFYCWTLFIVHRYCKLCMSCHQVVAIWVGSPFWLVCCLSKHSCSVCEGLRTCRYYLFLCFLHPHGDASMSCGLLCISLMTNDVEFLSIYLLAMCVLSLETCLSNSFAHFHIAYCLFAIKLEYSLYLWLWVSSQIWFLNISLILLADFSLSS